MQPTNFRVYHIDSAYLKDSLIKEQSPTNRQKRIYSPQGFNGILYLTMVF